MRYWIVDAFTDTRFTGNPAAVVLPDAFPPDAVMQSIAAENNLAETAFAVRDESGDWRLRWFTPTVEVDLCGHATLATAHVLAREGQGGPFRFHTRSGVLTATIEADLITLDFPARAHAPIAPPPGLEAVLGAPITAVLRSADLIAVLDDADHVAALRPDRTAILALPGGALIVTAPGGASSSPDGADITSRYFAPAYGIDEDQVTGSLHTQVVPYWAPRLGRDRLRCRQASARGGWLTCTLVRGDGGDRVRLAGTAVLYASGTIVTGGAA